MITVRKSEERRHVLSGIQDTWMTFDPDNGADPLQRGFHGLECLNEERMAPEMSLQSHTRKEIDLLTYVREGALIHQDENGLLARMEAGEFQHQSLTRTMRYHAVNGSPTDCAHVFQSCLTPDRIAPGANVEQRRFYCADRTGTLRTVASDDGRQSSLVLNQNVRLYSAILLLGSHLIHELAKGRTAWLHVVQGRIVLRDQSLGTGDGAALVEEAAVSFTAQESSEILLFDLS